MQYFKDYSFSVRSDIGTRDEQQDYYAYASNNDCFLAVVCDGMGGMENGALAAKTAAEKLIELFKQKDSSESFCDFFYDNIDFLDESVYKLTNTQTGEKSDCGTTIVAVGLEKETLYWLLVGDSRLYLMRGGEIEQSNRDHNYSLILDNMDLSIFPEEQLEKEKKKMNALISYVGMGGIDIFSINNGFKILVNDCFLLTTDGLFKILSNEEINRIVMSYENVDEAADALMESACRKEPRDNVTFILIKTGGNQYA